MSWDEEDEAAKRSKLTLLRFLQPGYLLRRPARLLLLLLALLLAFLVVSEVQRASLEAASADAVEQGFTHGGADQLLSETNRKLGALEAGDKSGTAAGPGRPGVKPRKAGARARAGQIMADVYTSVKGQVTQLTQRAARGGAADTTPSPEPASSVKWQKLPADVDKAEAVKAAMAHAWKGYETYAWGQDELMPLSKRGKDHFGSMGATIVDSLDTLFIMGHKEQFAKARDWVANSLNIGKAVDASVFETTIRVVGGLMSAFYLSGDDVFAAKAKELTDRLLPAFNTGTGIPLGSINLASGEARNPAWTGGSTILAELGTVQLEFNAVSRHTGDAKARTVATSTLDYIGNTYTQHPRGPSPNSATSLPAGTAWP